MRSPTFLVACTHNAKDIGKKGETNRGNFYFLFVCVTPIYIISHMRVLRRKKKKVYPNQLISNTMFGKTEGEGREEKWSKRNKKKGNREEYFTFMVFDLQGLK